MVISIIYTSIIKPYITISCKIYTIKQRYTVYMQVCIHLSIQLHNPIQSHICKYVYMRAILVGLQ